MKQIRQSQSRAIVGSAQWPSFVWPGVTLAFSAVFAFLVLVAPRPAQAGDALHEITWGHAASSSVQSFIIFISPESGAVDLARQVDVGVPAGEILGTIRLYTAIVSADENEFHAVAALGRNGLLSPLSAWGAVRPTQPGQPTLVVP